MKLNKIFIRILAALVVLILIFVSFRLIFADRIYPGVSVAGISLGGLNQLEAEKKLSTLFNSLESQAFIFSDGQRVLTLYPVDEASLEAALRVVEFSAADTAAAAYGFAHSSNWFKDFYVIIKSGVFFHQQDIVYDLDEDLVLTRLKGFFSSLEKEKANADLEFYSVKGPNGEVISFSVSPEKIGQTYDYDKAIETFKEQLSKAQFSDIKLSLKLDYPDIYASELGDAVSKAGKLVRVSPIQLIFKNPLNDKEQNFTLTASEMAAMIGFERSGGEVNTDFILPKIEEYLVERVASSTSKEPVMPKFEMKGGKVSGFGAGSDGYKLNASSSAVAIKEAISRGDKEVNLQVDIIKNDTPDNINEYGIKELIGSGHSNFAGSPSNRRVNIRVGANSVGGLLVKPGEEFSLVDAIGEVDAESGYLPELVIKNNKTIPEYGGGLCQVGTTLFRAALYSGLPITARRNHSYRVSYYEPAGMDASIYIPNPDVRFLNDTGHYILIQYRIEGDDFYFDFWGQKDGRQVTVTDPVIYNITKPEPTLIVESTDLAPGEKKCTERAHNGADAYFDYKVTYNNGDVVDKRFSSHYVPWREVCLVGVAASSTESVATSTPAN